VPMVTTTHARRLPRLLRGGLTDETTGRTFASFGFEWNNFDEVRTEDEGFAEVYFRDLDLTSLEGKVGLDAGCGKGRYTRFMAAHLAATAALDGSSAVEAASRNLADRTRCWWSSRPAPGAVRPAASTSSPAWGCSTTWLIPGRFHPPPRPPGSGGRILLYLYSRPPASGALGGPRRGCRTAQGHGAPAPPAAQAVEHPHRRLSLLRGVAPGAYGDRAGVAALAGLPMDAYRGKPFRSLVLDTFDRLSAPVEHRYVWKDLAPWFADAGLVVDAARDETGWFILAHKPERAG